MNAGAVRTLIRAVLAPLAALALAVLPVQAGSPGWALSDLVLRQGPHVAHDVAGTIPAETRISIERCAPRWCLVSSGNLKGWTGRDHVGFGQAPRPPLSGPRLDYGAGGPGTVCFFSGANFTGSSFCRESGFVAPDLGLYGFDDRIRSVSVSGNVSARICRDRNFQSHCVRVVENAAHLERYLNAQVSSLRVH